MKFIKFIVLLIVLLVALYIFLVNFSAAKSRYECSGTLLNHVGETEQKTIYFKLEEYRWWVDLWANSDTDGNFWIEIPTMSLQWYPIIENLDTQLQIKDGGNNLRGNFSKLSKTLSFDTVAGFFDGACKEID